MGWHSEFFYVRTSAVVTCLDLYPGKQPHTRASRSSCGKPNGRKRFKRGQHRVLDGELVQVDQVRPMYRNRQPVYSAAKQRPKTALRRASFSCSLSSWTEKSPQKTCREWRKKANSPFGTNHHLPTSSADKT